MAKRMKRLQFDQIIELLKKVDTESIYDKVTKVPQSDDLYHEMEKYVNLKNFPRFSVLGIDIYRYGLYKHLEQTMIPALFKILFDKTVRLCLENNQFVFQYYTKEKIQKSFISTGDGGFLIFDTPLHALFFAINFEVMVRAFNSYHHYPKLRKVIGSISLRYAITYDTIFHFENNFYGSAIINNARILEKDSLNRCLLDQRTYEWFLTNIDGIENLQTYTIHDIANIYEYTKYDKKYIKSGENDIINTRLSRYTGIINSDILRIGQFQSKEVIMNIFNLHLQITLYASADDKKETKRRITVSLGNLNTSGI
ncbi:MAG: hypothetical protein DRJ15_06610 [Bacteroidetes bacterium]|nr:MAG: hypothetical protein DRI83_06330 [Bacteroidota bacterium]RLD80608.1 MAG: hypothetical protein DRJ15_06610 [Bacteroidota bacterium]